ncbi:MAG: cupin domain-containing protein [Oscillospiraceae bacterium]|nr:cupin domain-containing protein [Oscillospiraceae bacterium]
MELVQVLQTDFEHSDERGRLTQLVHEGFRQINVLTTKRGVTRGGHFHKVSREAFYIVSGSVEVALKTAECSERAVFHAGDFFSIGPYVSHSMFFPEDCVMVQMYDRPVEQPNGEKDIYSEALLFGERKGEASCT